MDFERYKNDIVDNGWNVYGVEVYENGVLTHSYGDTTDGKYDTTRPQKVFSLLR